MGPSPRGRGNHTAAADIRLLAWSIPAWAGKPRRGDGRGVDQRVHPRVGGETCGKQDIYRADQGPSPRGRGNPTSTKSETHRPGVHPRVGGETSRSRRAAVFCWGPSPRGRGNPPRNTSPCVHRRSIPAWAGKPGAVRLSWPRTWVHPRVGGETHDHARHQAAQVGPSPRGRGNPGRAATGRGIGGSIPAWAGKPSTPRTSACGVRVHPRVGGETAATSCDWCTRRGPSPRGRGNRRALHPHARYSGSIPAWAGKPKGLRAGFGTLGVHPRVGGETWPGWSWPNSSGGPSPRGRGNPGLPGRPPGFPGSIPAWAGKPDTCCSGKNPLMVHPRVGGETCDRARSQDAAGGPSPRGRGNRAPPARPHAMPRSIPAWAGKPGQRSCQALPLGVHPRVGGETSSIRTSGRPRSGPSPRGRGNPVDANNRAIGTGSIPAWAGKPVRAPCRREPPAVHPRVGGET